MRICLLTYRGNMYCGGQGGYVYYLAKALHELGHEVHVIAGPPYPTPPDGVKLHKLEGLNLYETNGFSLLSSPLRMFTPINLYEAAAVHIGMFPDIFTFSMRAYLKLRDLMSRQRFDIIHDNQTLGYGLLLAKSLGVPIVATIHHPISIDMAASLAEVKSWLTRFRRTIFYSFLIMQGVVSRRMDRVVTVSKTSAEDTIRAFKLREDRVRIVHNGVDTGIFRRLDHVEKEPNSLVIVGKTEDKKKGVPFLLKAVQLLKDDVDVKVSVVGIQGPDDGYRTKLVQGLGIGDRVTFTGHIGADELVRLYSSAEIAVTASLYEGFGLPAAEAMACGTPVIATRAGALPEIVGEYGTGILVPPADPPALAAAIKRLLADRPLRQRMGEAARKRIEESFSWEVAARKTLEVYEEVL
ncbi:MAG: glycosyltransferase family 1 protein [Dehalococcoidia bacterium]|nr:MAG: glycosyltransferase family 1 protein [Dehalococcoidia bacterium]